MVTGGQATNFAKFNRSTKSDVPFSKSRALPWLAYPKLVHVDEGRRVLDLKDVPIRQVGHCNIIGKASSEILLRSQRQNEPKELQVILLKKGADLRQRQLMLLNVEKHIAACAGAEKVSPLGNPG